MRVEVLLAVACASAASRRTKSCGESFFSGTYIRWSWMSGTMPRFWIERSPGVRYCAIVSLSLRVVVVVVELLDRALAERARADDRRAVEVLERAGDDLRRRRRAAVDEHGERRRGVAEAALGAARLAVAARHRRDDRAASRRTGRRAAPPPRAGRPGCRAGRGSTTVAPLRAHLAHRVGDVRSRCPSRTA